MKDKTGEFAIDEFVELNIKSKKGEQKCCWNNNSQRI